MQLTKAKLRQLLALQHPVAVDATGQEVSLERVDETGSGDVCVQHFRIGVKRIPALCLSPIEAGNNNGIGILYCHAHGNNYAIGKREMTQGRPALLDPPLGLELARNGATVLCIDLASFGERQDEGAENALAKAALWQGKTLLGTMLDDLAIAHRALLTMPQVNPARVSTVGISMGGTLAYLYAAFEDTIRSTAHMCVFSNIKPLLATGAHDLHGFYLTIPGLLPDYDMDQIAALLAPRPQLIATGSADPLTPAEAYEPAVAHVQEAYRNAGAEAHLQVLREPDSGHIETEAMRAAVLSFLNLKT